MTFGEIEDAITAFRGQKSRFVVRVNLTEPDLSQLLAHYGVPPGPNGAGIWPLASFRGLPVYYGERSEIVYNDGTTEPLYNSP